MIDPQAEYYNLLLRERSDQALQCGWEGETEQLERYFELYDGVEWKFSTVLDVGCGTGIASTIYSIGYTGIDINSNMIKEAKSLYPHDIFITESIFDHQGKYDLVVCSGAMNLFHQPSIDAQYIWFTEFVYRMCELGERVAFNLTSVGSEAVYESYGSGDFSIMMYDLGKVYGILTELGTNISIQNSKLGHGHEVVIKLTPN